MVLVGDEPEGAHDDKAKIGALSPHVVFSFAIAGLILTLPKQVSQPQCSQQLLYSS